MVAMAAELKETQGEVEILKELLFRARTEIEQGPRIFIPTPAEQYQETPRKQGISCEVLVLGETENWEQKVLVEENQ